MVLEKEVNNSPCSLCGGEATRDCFNAERWQVTPGPAEWKLERRCDKGWRVCGACFKPKKPDDIWMCKGCR